MCLAIPARVTSMEPNSMARMDIMGVSRTISVDLVPEAAVGDFVLVHAGFAIQVIDEQTAKETLELIESLPLFADPEPEPTPTPEGA